MLHFENCDKGTKVHVLFVNSGSFYSSGTVVGVWVNRKTGPDSVVVSVDRLSGMLVEFVLVRTARRENEYVCRSMGIKCIKIGEQS